MSTEIAAVIFQTGDQNDSAPDITEMGVKLADQDWYEKARTIRRDPTVSLARAILGAPVIKTPWRVEGQDPAAVELVKKTILPLQNIVMREAVNSCIDYGWQAWEVRPQTVGQTRYLRSRAVRHDYTTPIVDRKGFPAGFKNESQNLSNDTFPEVEILWPYAAFVSGNEEYGNVIGEPLLKNVEKVIESYDEVEESARRYCKKVAGTHWVLYYPVGTSTIEGETVSNSKIAKSVLESLRASGTVALPVSAAELQAILSGSNTPADAKKSGWDLQMLESSAGLDPFLDRQQYLDALKMRALLVPERTALEGHFGTKAESSEHADMAMLAIEQWGRGIMNWLNSPYGFVGSVLEFNKLQYYPGAVEIVQLPLADDDKSYMREMFRTMLNGDARYAQTIDLAALADRTNVPTMPNVQAIIERFLKQEEKNDRTIPEEDSGTELEDEPSGGGSPDDGGSDSD